MWLRLNRLCEGGDIATALGKRGFLMNKLSFAIVGAAALALAACGAKKEATENIEDNYATENLETMANETANESVALENQAGALENEGAAAAEPATDSADTNAASVNAM